MIDDPEEQRPVDLAGTPDFDLGAMRGRPSLCRVEYDGRSEHLEPRVMQVLVALAEAVGGVVTRDQLIARCWDGRIVGEDAINRVLGRLRALARSAEGAFAIETVPRVGYRLVVSDEAPAAEPQRPDPSAPPRQAHRSRRRLGWAALVVATVAILVGGVMVWRQSQPVVWRAGDYMEISGDVSQAMKPDVSPDGRYVVYTAPPLDEPEAENHDIWMRNVEGGDAVRLVSDPAHDNAPAFAPDGASIAFIRTDENYEAGHIPSRPCRLIVKPLPDGVEREVGRCPRMTGAGTLDWTADGTGLLFTDLNASWLGRIMRLDIASGEISQLTHPPPGNRDFAGVDSRDGRRLAFLRFSGEGASDVWIQDIPSGDLTRVTRTNAFIGSVDWAPDGRGLFFADEAGDLWWVPARADATPRRLLVGLRRVNRLSAGPDLIAFESIDGVTRVWRGEPDGEREVVRLNGSVFGLDVSATGDLALIGAEDETWLWLQPAGGEARPHIRLEMVHPRAAIWSPEGTRIAFLGEEDGRSHAYVLPMEGGRSRRLEVPTGDLVSLAWIESGRALAVVGRDNAGFRIWRVGLGSGDRPRPMYARGFPWIRSTRDGTLYGMQPGSISDIYRLAPSGAATLLDNPNGARGYWWVSEDGLLRLSASRREIWLHPFDDGPASLIFRQETPVDRYGAFDPSTGEFVQASVIEADRAIGRLRLERE